MKQNSAQSMFIKEFLLNTDKANKKNRAIANPVKTDLTVFWIRMAEKERFELSRRFPDLHP